MVSFSARAKAASLRARLGLGGERARLVAAVAAAIFLLDLFTKVLATQLLSGRGEVEVLGGLVRLRLYRNFAGPNDILPDSTVLLSLFAIVAAAVLAVVAFRVLTTAAAIAVGLLLGGALGNLSDRLLREPAPLKGGVIDWLAFGDLTKLMNVADVAIHLAIAVVLVAGIQAWWREREAAKGAGGSLDRQSRG